MNLLRTLLAVAVIILIGALIFAYSGVYNVAADEPHWQITRWFLETTQARSIAVRQDEVRVPADLDDPARQERGAQIYGTRCQMCHLGPGVDPTPVHEGLKPQPPRLSRHAAEHSHKNLFWTVKHGFKMTGMPAWGKTHTDDQLWDVVVFLKQLPGMTPEQYRQAVDGGRNSHAPTTDE